MTQMALMSLKRCIKLVSVVNSKIPSEAYSFCSRGSLAFLEKGSEETQSASAHKKQINSTNYPSMSHLSPLFYDSKPDADGYNIELVDYDTWQVSSGLAQAWQGADKASEIGSFMEGVDEPVDYSSRVEDDLDIDEIDNMRIRGNLFYKLDRSSKEFEEYNIDFHRKKKGKSIENKDEQKESKKEEKPSQNLDLLCKKLSKVVRSKYVVSSPVDTDSSFAVKKKLRTPTFNQLTGPYHEPFCLDLYISKASVRACIVHRVTSKVVAVAHSISKDMKFDLASTRDSTACAAVGGVLAQRALADDIHDVIYTPRKGEKLEGKLRIVLQSIIDNGLNVKVKIKQRKPKRVGLTSTP